MKFAVGDQVQFVEIDPYDGYTAIEERHRANHGKAPYTVEEIEDDPEWYANQRQRVIVNGHRYSSDWFRTFE